MSIDAYTTDLQLASIVSTYYKDDWPLMTELERETRLTEADDYRQQLIDENEIKRLLAEQKLQAPSPTDSSGMGTINPELLRLSRPSLAAPTPSAAILSLHQQCRGMAAWARSLFRIHVGASSWKPWEVAPAMSITPDILNDVHHIAQVTAEAFNNKSRRSSVPKIDFTLTGVCRTTWLGFE